MNRKLLHVCILVFLSNPLFVEGREIGNAEFIENAVSEYNKSSIAECVETFPCFEINLNYPEEYDESESLPWEEISFSQEPLAYMNAIRIYAAQGNIRTDWNVKKNPVRNWYHAPWMHRGERAREPLRGLTRERGSRLHELSAHQSRQTNNWAIGFYNDRGGYEFGKVWSDKSKPNTDNVRFPLGTVSVKLLFTDATDSEAPYLKGNGTNLTWYAKIDRDSAPVPLRLLQVDFAVRDDSADSTTGWVLGTFMFDASKGSSNYWDNLVPVGLQWGNDPNLTREAYDNGARPQEGWINPVVAQLFSSHRPPFGELGYLGRMNGPVDNPLSTCVGCHGRAVDTKGADGPKFRPRYADMCLKYVRTVGNNTYEKIVDCVVSEDAEARIKVFFRNLKPGDPFLPGTKSLDYSLQMADGVAQWRKWRNQNYPSQFEAVASPYSINSETDAVVSGFSSNDIQIPTMPVHKAFGRGDEDF